MPPTKLTPAPEKNKMDQAPKTVIYIHGIGNKPPGDILKCQWDTGIFEKRMGDKSRMAYWVNRERYPLPEPGTCADPDDLTLRSAGGADFGPAWATAYSTGMDEEEKAMFHDKQAKGVLEALSKRLLAAGDALEESPPGEIQAKLLPLPASLRRILVRLTTKTLLKDVYDFFYREDQREIMRQSLLSRMQSGGPFVVVSHSQGTMVAYDLLCDLDPAQYPVPLFVTLGSPLGIQEVRDCFKAMRNAKTLSIPKCVGRWVNVANRFDVVALDADISNDFTPKNFIENHIEAYLNPDNVINPHAATGYLTRPIVRETVQSSVGKQFSDMLAQYELAPDLADSLESRPSSQRSHVLIQLCEHGEGTLDEMRVKVVATLGTLTGNAEEARIDPLKRYVTAELNRDELEKLRDAFKDLTIFKVWKNAVKTTCIMDSIHTVKAYPAIEAYNAKGQGIVWAVVDTGVNHMHPHFHGAGGDAVAAVWDCAKQGPPDGKDGGGLDMAGHGTHVAGIIAGQCDVTDEETGAPVSMSGMAPLAKLHCYKALDDKGRGRDGWIIKALDHIATVNEEAGKQVIHGVNLSLGGPFNPRIWGCGHTPLCTELRRLWNQGVIVVLAAGNEGYCDFYEQYGVAIQANLDISIGDPANLDEAIAVGSVHCSNPFTYGVSHFSSRGPTADGRAKPDLVAPGEKIWSAAHVPPQPGGRSEQIKPSDLINFAKLKSGKNQKGLVKQQLYIPFSGTSMAAPHVSGLLAAFLSARREFIGQPDKVKKILLANCADLGRDPYSQGRGLPNLVKMLIET